jgi:hypothetical protein
MTRNKNINDPATELRNLDLARAEDNTAELRDEAARNTRLLQVARITELVDDAASIIAETDRAALLSICSMNNTELLIYLKMVEVYDIARSHFLFEIVEPQVKRFLNAERLKAEALAPPLTLSYNQYKSLLLERTQNSKLTGPAKLHPKTSRRGMPCLLVGRRKNFGSKSTRCQWFGHDQPSLVSLHHRIHHRG